MSELNPTFQTPSRPTSYEERFRLYIDESGDHVFKHSDEPAHRYLCLLGVWFKNPDYESFHRDLEQVKQDLFDPHPDDPVILHREDIVNRRGVFNGLRDPEKAQRFDERLLAIVGGANFRVVAVVIDKKVLRDQFGCSLPGTLHPYHMGVQFIFEQYREYLIHIQRCGDVMAESRGGKEDRLLKDVYETVGKTVRGWQPQDGGPFQPAITSKEIKVKPKSANISGLQLADLLAHPCRHDILREFGRTADDLGAFARHLLAAIGGKFHRHIDTGEVKGSGKHLCPGK
jgi:hypothetical protein